MNPSFLLANETVPVGEVYFDHVMSKLHKKFKSAETVEGMEHMVMTIQRWLPRMQLVLTERKNRERQIEEKRSAEVEDELLQFLLAQRKLRRESTS
tara:strand:+ start:4298 stop:4585 length:288 start_codon:yes stop_codon:yes gene_type:complete